MCVLVLASVLVKFYLQSNLVISVNYFVDWNINLYPIYLYMRYIKAHIVKKLLESQSPLDAILLSLNKNSKREQKFLLSGN